MVNAKASRRHRITVPLFLLLGGWIMIMFAAPPGSHGVQKFYPRTPTGVIETKTIPESRILVTESDGSYFDESNQLFGRLFDYIKVHSIPMTAPVEGSVDEEGRMIFYVGKDVKDEGLTDEGQVRVVRLPERTVMAIGGRGSYKEKNVRKYLDQLKAHMAAQSEYEVIGPAYTVFWNPPFIPWFLRHLEVHIPVRPAGSDGIE
jgi:effector-binding domain-containing protein